MGFSRAFNNRTDIDVEARALRQESSPSASTPAPVPRPAPTPPPPAPPAAPAAASAPAASTVASPAAAATNTNGGTSGTANARSAQPRHARTSFNSQSVISLGTLIMNFVAKPLAKLKTERGTPKFAEVQVFFYNFNDKASMMSRCNVSMFPIFTDFFSREYSRLRLESSSRAVRFTVGDFLSFVANKMVDDPMNPAYNIQDLYKRAENTSRNSTSYEYASVTVNGQTRAMTGDEFNRRIEQKMREPGIGNVSGSSTFVMPQLSFEVEAVPTAENPRDGKTILKLHIFDRASSSTSPLRDLLSMSTNDMMMTMHAVPGDVGNAEQIREQRRAEEAATASRSRTHSTPIDLATNWEGIFNDIATHAINERIIEEIPQAGSKVYQYVGGPATLKRMVSQYIPNIIYGAMGTTVKSANISSKEDALLATMNIQRSLNGDPILPNGQQVGGVPLSIYPVDLSITTLGCPMLRFSQEIFVDFNTNTTADNIYYITGLTHKFEAGTYESTIKLTANDAFGQYRSFINQLNQAKAIVQRIRNLDNQQTQTSTPANPSTTR